MAASMLRNVRCSKFVVFLPWRLNFRGSNRRIHSTSWRFVRGTGSEVKATVVDGKEGKNDPTSADQRHSVITENFPPASEEDFFGILRGEGVTEVRQNKDAGPVDVFAKYETLMTKSPSDMEKVYITNFGTIRLDGDNPVKFHGQLEGLRLKPKVADELGGREFPEPETPRQKKLRNNRQSDTDSNNDHYHHEPELILKNQNSKLELKSDGVEFQKVKKQTDSSVSLAQDLPETTTALTRDNPKQESQVSSLKPNRQKCDSSSSEASNFIDEQYFGLLPSNEQNRELDKSVDLMSPMDVGYFDKLYASEVDTTNQREETGKVAVSSEVNDTNYSSYVLARFQNDDMLTKSTMSNDAIPEDSYLEANMFRHEQSPLKPFFNESSQQPDSQNELISEKEVNTFATNKHCPNSNEPTAASADEKEENLRDGQNEPTLDKNYSSYVLNVLPNETNTHKNDGNSTLPPNESVKSNFIEESIIEYAETLQKSERSPSTRSSTAQPTAEMLSRLREPPPYFSKRESKWQPAGGDDANTFGNVMDKSYDRRRKNVKTQNYEVDLESEKQPIAYNTSDEFSSRTKAIVGLESKPWDDAYRVKSEVVEAKSESSVRRSTRDSREPKGENTIFGTHQELKSRQRTVADLAHKQRRSTTKPQQPPLEPVLDEDAEYVEPEDRGVPSRDNLGLRLRVPEPRFDKKPKFPPRHSDDDPMYADEFVSEFLKEEPPKVQETEEDITFEDDIPVNLRKLAEKTQNLEEQPEFVVLQLLKDSVMYNNNGVLVLYKPYGLPMQPSKGYRHNLVKFLPELAKFVDHENPSPELFTVHRIDRGTTGVLVLAKTQAMANSLHDLFKTRKVRKTYWAITKGIPNPLQGIIKIPIAEGTIVGRRRMVLKPDYNENTKLVVKKSSVSVHEAITPFRVLTAKGNAALVEATPETGVTHQLRVHFGFGLGCPVLGDHKYTHLNSLAPQRLPADMLRKLDVRQSKVRDLPIHLHARSIVIPEILDGKNLYIQAGLPKHMQWAVRKLKLRRGTSTIHTS